MFTAFFSTLQGFVGFAACQYLLLEIYNITHVVNTSPLGTGGSAINIICSL